MTAGSSERDLSKDVDKLVVSLNVIWKSDVPTHMVKSDRQCDAVCNVTLRRSIRPIGTSPERSLYAIHAYTYTCMIRYVRARLTRVRLDSKRSGGM